MARTFADLIVQTSQTTGTSAYDLDDGAVAGARTFRQGYSDGDAPSYVVQNAAGTKWEKNRGGAFTLGTPDKLARSVVLSTNSNAPVSWTSSDLPLTIYVPRDSDVDEGIITGFLAASRHALLRAGARWWKSITGGWEDTIYSGGADIRRGFFDTTKVLYFPDNRRSSTAIGAGNRVFTASDIGGSFTFNTSAAARTGTLPPGSTVKDGYHVELKGLSTANGIILTPDSGDGIDGGADGATKTIPGGVLFTVRWSNADDMWLTDYKAPAAAVISTPLVGLFSKLKISVTSDTAITVTADSVVLSDGTTNQIVSAFNKTIAAGSSGAGGLDTGSMANSTWYFVWAIAKADGTNAAMLSASATGPTMPSGYTFKARLGAVVTDSSADLYRTLQLGRRAQYVVTISTNTDRLRSMATGSAGDVNTPTWAAVAVGSFVPPTASRISTVLATNTGQAAILAPNNAYDDLASSINPPPVITINIGSTSAYLTALSELMLESTNLYWATTDATLYCLGWEDNL